MATIIENPGSSKRPSNKTSSSRDVIGLAFPFRKEKGEFPRRAINMDAVKGDLLCLFRTPMGSRVMKPLVGSNKEQLIFESTGPLLLARLDRNIRQTIYNNDPRINVIAINVEEQATTVTATILYSVQGVSDTVTLTMDRGNA